MGKSSLSDKFSNEMIVSFCDSMSPLLNSGIKIDLALHTVASGISSDFSLVLKDISAGINSGLTLTEAFSNYPSCFSRLFIEFISVGENTGRVDLQLEKIRKIASKEQQFQENIAEIFRPIKVIVVVILGLFILNITVLSPFVFKTIGGGSGWVHTYFTFVVFLNKYCYWVWIAFVIFGVFLITGSIDNLKPSNSIFSLLIPGLSKLEYNKVRGRFFLTLSNLIESGIDMQSALKSSALASSDTEVLFVIESIIGLIKNGQGLAYSFRRTELFEHNILAIIETAEQSGNYEKCFVSCSDHYDKVVEKCINSTMHRTKLVTFFVFAFAFFLNMALMFLPLLGALGI